MRRYVFNEVAIKATHRWKDSESGKNRQETRKFFQTINPFNKNAAGEIKSCDEIMVEIRAERDAWLAAQREVKP
ncbi:hypothetical protein [Acidovorax sp. FJL06]|uniref:hypothetical protein n=1 Tax=Acidovorax sp. FJL06 TaxID=2153365 RepID=UPI000F584512|nr:hypothetical protein [Acidovorax sp. FJL06]RQO83533.1 hypothetical protein DBV10_04210 [Acidovorax sp. FJL06]